MEDRQKHVGEAIRAYRQARGFTQSQLAQLSLVSRDTVSLVELGKGRPHRNTIERLARALRVKVVQLERFDPSMLTGNRTEGESSAA